MSGESLCQYQGDAPSGSMHASSNTCLAEASGHARPSQRHSVSWIAMVYLRRHSVVDGRCTGEQAGSHSQRSMHECSTQPRRHPSVARSSHASRRQRCAPRGTAAGPAARAAHNACQRWQCSPEPGTLRIVTRATRTTCLPVLVAKKSTRAMAAAPAGVPQHGSRRQSAAAVGPPQ